MEMAQLKLKELRTRESYTIQMFPKNIYGCGTRYFMVWEGKCMKVEIMCRGTYLEHNRGQR